MSSSSFSIALTFSSNSDISSLRSSRNEESVSSLKAALFLSLLPCSSDFFSSRSILCFSNLSSFETMIVSQTVSIRLRI
jgi:hypothetical protein